MNVLMMALCFSAGQKKINYKTVRNTVKIPTVKELRQKGWKVCVGHFRYTSPNSDAYPISELGSALEIMSKGGKTIIEARSPEGVEMKGEAICARTDNYNKRYGVALAMSRALDLKVAPQYKVGDVKYTLYKLGRGFKIKRVKVEPDSDFPDPSTYIYFFEGGYYMAQHIESTSFVYVETGEKFRSYFDLFDSREDLIASL